jgi:hypothetical protein
MAKLLKAGAGRQGYCKLCSFDEPTVQDAFDKRVLDYSPAQLNAWLKTKGIDPVNRQTIYSHREHVKAPEDRVVQARQRRDMAHGKQPRRTSESEFLDAVIALGHENALLDPGSVTVDQALKATQIKQAAKAKGDAHQTLVAIFTGNYNEPATVVEGESREI